MDALAAHQSWEHTSAHTLPAQPVKLVKQMLHALGAHPASGMSMHKQTGKVLTWLEGVLILGGRVKVLGCRLYAVSGHAFGVA